VSYKLNDAILLRVLAAVAHSELLRAVTSVRSDGGLSLALGSAPLRPLTELEIAQLEFRGNTAEDWSRVRVAEGFDVRRVRQSSFHGDVALGRFTQSVRLADGVELPSGIWQSTLVNCVVGHDTLVRDVKLLANYVIGQQAILFDCGRVVCEGRTAFGNGRALSVGIECGGREVAVYAEIDLEVATAVARSRRQRQFLQQYGQLVAGYAERASFDWGIVSREAVVCHTPRVQNTYVGPGARVEGATQVLDSTLLSGPGEITRVESGACLTGVLLQWGSSAASQALVEHSVLMEHAHAERQGKVTHSIVGPNTTVAEGEVTACLLGPFVGFHHQALLIAALWPEGKGNIGSGANVGSNHTSKAPDQEFWPGEGTFIGLGVNVKYPSDFRRAPYSVLACGVSTLPQKLAFPFSLVNVPSVQVPGVSPAYNEISPAWVLAHNLYAVKRNEGKYRARNRARRTVFPFAVFRPEIVEWMRDACARLEAVAEPKDAYTDRDIPGLGKNFVLERGRQTALTTYRFFVRYYALSGLLEHVRTLAAEKRPVALDAVLATPGESETWEHQRQLLCGDLRVTDLAAGLRELAEMAEEVARSVERSKAKDDERGGAIIDDYEAVHHPAAEDPFVRQTWEETRRLQAEVRELLASCAALASPRAPEPIGFSPLAAPR
jgi:hypothetical protein